MVTRNLYKVEELLKSSIFMVNGFLTAIIDFNVTSISGTRTFGIYGDIGTPTSSSPIPNIWLNGNKVTGNISVSTIGNHRIVVDLVNVKNLLVNVVNNAGYSATGTCRICFTPMSYDDYIKYQNAVDDKFSNSTFVKGGSEEIYDTRDIKQVDIRVKRISKSDSAANRYVRVYKSDDGATWENATNFVCEIQNLPGGYADISDIDEINLYGNVEDANYIKIKIETPSDDVYLISPILCKEYKEFRTFLLDISSNSYNGLVTNLFKGYRYVKIGLNNQVGSTNANIFFNERAVVLNSDYERIEVPYTYPFYATGINRTLIRLIGKAYGGGIGFDFGSALSELRIYTGGTGTFGSIYVTLSNSIPTITEEAAIEKNDYKIVNCPIKVNGASRDVFGADALEYTSSELYYYQYGYKGLVWKCEFNSDNVENLIEGETIRYAYLMPYNYKSNVGTLRLPNRIVVFTNKNRILFNNAEEEQYFTNFNYFKEARVINPFKKWQPVNNIDDVDNVHKYFPVLKDYNYDQFKGRSVIQGTTEGDLLVDFSVDNSWNSRSYNTLARANKVAIFGNYNQANTEPYVLATVDGGKTWKVVLWFAHTTDYPNSAAGEIDLSPISSQAAYTPNSLKLCIRKYRVPTEENPEPLNTFIIDEVDQVDVSSFSTDSNGNCLVNLSESKNFGGYSPVCFFKNNGSESIWDTICNNNMTEDGVNNNGIFFRLKKISNTQYQLRAMIGNPYEASLMCYHIHCVNRCSAGFVISTGESYTDTNKYEGGMVYFLTCNYNNGTNTLYGGIDSLINNTIRLTSSPNGVNRACGAYLFNDFSDPTFLYVSDESFYTTGKRNASIPKRTIQVKNVPTGIFIGKLSDIDNQSKFECICDAKSTIVSLCEHMGHFAADGHGDALCLSKNGKDWHIETNMYKNTVNGTDMNGCIYFGDYKVVFK